VIGQSVASFLAGDDGVLAARLAQDAARHFRVTEAQQLRAWDVTLACLREALAGWQEAAG
jgi:hypothetical protein